MVQFSYLKTKLLLILGTALGISVMFALILSLQPNKSVLRENIIQTPPPMSSLLEECGPFYTFPDNTIQQTLNPTAEGGTLIPLTESPNKEKGQNLGKDAFKKYTLKDKDRPTVNDALTTADKYDGYIIWYSPKTKADKIESLEKVIQNSKQNVMLLPWEGGHLKGDKSYKKEELILPQDRLFGFYSSTKTTQSCNFADPYAFKNFINFTESTTAEYLIAKETS